MTIVQQKVNIKATQKGSPLQGDLLDCSITYKVNKMNKKLAEALDVYQKDISRWEKNELTPNTLTFAKICKVLNASADEILELQ